MQRIVLEVVPLVVDALKEAAYSTGCGAGVLVNGKVLRVQEVGAPLDVGDLGRFGCAGGQRRRMVVGHRITRQDEGQVDAHRTSRVSPTTRVKLPAFLGAGAERARKLSATAESIFSLDVLIDQPHKTNCSS